MNKKNQIRLFMIMLIIMALIFSACVMMLTKTTEKHFIDSSDILFSQIESLIKHNQSEQYELQESLKEDYLSRAKALAYILEKNPEIQRDYSELCRIADLLGIDEINVFDQDGLIAYSTIKDYIGFSIYSGGQIAFFEQMMYDHSLELAQDLTPNTKEDKLTMYAAVWRSDDDSIVQVGITPERLLAALEKTGISTVLDKMPVESSLYIIYDSDKDEIVSATDNSLLGLSNKDITFDFANISDNFSRISYNGKDYLYTVRSFENYSIGICELRSYVFRDVKTNAIILFLFLLASLAGIFAITLFMTGEEKKIEKQYVSELRDYADQLSNYKRAILSDALISLEVNLSNDELYYGVWKDDNGVQISLKDILGLELPCSYEKYITLWNKRFIKNFDSEEFAGSTDITNLLEAFSRGETEITFDYQAYTISGRSAWLRRSICMTQNQEGDVIAFTSVKDITALIEKNKREEEFVRALATEYDSISVVDNNKDKSKDRVIIHSRVSETLIDILDDSVIKEELFIKKLENLLAYIHPDDRESFDFNTKKETIYESFADDQTHIVNFRLRKSEEEDMYFQMRFVPMFDDDHELISMIVGVRNIDDEIRKELGVRKELEDAMIASEAANQAKSTFLFNMSHDIRTPMNAIIGFTDIAQNHLDDKDRVKDSLNKVKTASEHLLSLINDVLDMSRVESGNVKLEEEPVYIEAVNDNLYSILAGTAAEKNIKLNFVSDSSIEHLWIYADRLRLMRVLTNIVSNSVKYTNPGGTIDIQIREIPCEHEGYAHLCYTVADTGIGMTKEFLETVFEPFSRAESATKSGVIGTGLGMSITKSLVELMGGTIDIESEVGKGTIVYIEIEHRISDPVVVDEDQKNALDIDLAGKKILLVEDNELNREIAVEILEEVGVIVDGAEDGDIAVEKISNAKIGQYDLVLMDIQMPRMNGYEATKAIRALPNKYASGIPIIAMTANAFEEDKKNALEAGMNGHIAKPINVPELLHTLSDILGK